MAYTGSVELISGIRQKNGQDFPLVDASAVRVNDETRLDDSLSEMAQDIDRVANPGVTYTGKAIVVNSAGNAVPNYLPADGVSVDKQTDQAFTHFDVATAIKINSVTFFPNELAFGTCKFLTKPNVAPNFAAIDSDFYGINIKGSGHFAILNGTNEKMSGHSCRTLMNNVILDTPLKANTKYTLLVYTSATVDSTLYINLTTSTADESSSGTVWELNISQAGVATKSFQRTYAVRKLSLALWLPNTEVTLDNVRIWFGIVEDGYEIIDTGHTISSEDFYEYIIQNNKIAVDTIMHESIIGYIAKLSDNLGNSDASGVVTYLYPEAYGASGNGTTDDSDYLQACIDDAVLKNLPVRAYGNYIISKGISITGGIDVFINQITFTGSGVAIVIQGLRNKFSGNFVSAYDAVNCTAAIQIEGISGGSKCNIIDVTTIYAYNDAVIYDSVDSNIFYNKLSSSRIISRYGHCIRLCGNGLVSENDFYLKSLACRNGYVIYSETSNVTNTVYRAGIENECANGIYGVVSMYQCRTVECMDQRDKDASKGTIIKIPAGYMSQDFKSDVLLCLECVDVSQSDTFEDRLDIIVAAYEAGKTLHNSIDEGFGSTSSRVSDYVIGFCIRTYYNAPDGYTLDSDYDTAVPIYGKLIAYYRHKGIVPLNPATHTITEGSYYTIYKGMPTKMILATNSNIYLDDSYCCVGINEFQIVQTNDYKATVYDKFGTVIFDGSNYDAGTYRFTCNLVPFTSLTLQRPGGGTIEIPYSRLAYVYTGENEEWTIEKLNIIN